MRVGIDATPLHAGSGGIGTYTECLIRALACGGDPPELVLYSRSVPFFGIGRPAGVRSVTRGGATIRRVWSMTTLPGLVRETDPDVCHFPNFLAPPRIARPHVVTIHDVGIIRHPSLFAPRARHLVRPLLARVAASADAVLTVSSFSRREIVETLSVDPGRVHVVPAAPREGFDAAISGASLDAIRRRYALPDRYIVMVGSIEPRKNHLLIARALDEIGRDPSLRDVALVVVGLPGYRGASIRRQLLSSHYGRARVLGLVPAADLPAIVRLATCLAYPSRYEGFGLPILEAMAAGTPVVCTGNGAPAETAGTAALLVNPDDPKDLARGLARVLGDASLRAELVARGERRAARFTWTRAAARTRAVYERVLADRRARPARATSRHLTPDVRLPSAILAALAYADLFSFPLTHAEIRRSLGVTAGRHAISRCLRSHGGLRERVTQQNGLVCLRGRESTFARRPSEEARADRLVNANRRLLSRLARLPFVRMVAFSGGTSHRNAPEREDLDLFLVTAPGRAALVYALVVLVARLHRRRDLVCANFLVDENHLALDGPRDRFTAHELVHLRALTGAEYLDRLLTANAWALALLPNATAMQRIGLVGDGPGPIRRTIERVSSPVFEPLERLALRLLRRHVAKRIRRDRRAHVALARGDVVVRRGIVKLHIHDHRRPILARYRERLASLGPFATREADTGQRVKAPAGASGA